MRTGPRGKDETAVRGTVTAGEKSILTQGGACRGTRPVKLGVWGVESQSRGGEQRQNDRGHHGWAQAQEMGSVLESHSHQDPSPASPSVSAYPSHKPTAFVPLLLPPRKCDPLLPFAPI